MNSTLALIVTTIITAIGWVSTTIFTFGRLYGTVQRHDKVLGNGLVEQLSQLKAQVSGLDATIKTYIDLKR